MRWLIASLLLLSVNVFAVGQVYQAHDATGRLIKLSKPAHRIISLAPSITEMVYAAGAGQYLIARDSASNYPHAVLKLPIIANSSSLDLERIIQLHPDLVIAWQGGNPQGSLNKLKDFGIKIYYTSPKKILDIADNIKQIGLLAGTIKRANQAAKNFKKKYAHLKQQYSQARKIKVFYQLWYPPLITVNGQGFISNVIRLCGGENVFAKALIAAPNVSVEAVVDANPSVIIAGQTKQAWQHLWRAWPTLQAVKNKALFSVPADLISRPGPRILQGAAMICRDLQRVRKQS